ncbi:hypothetical protein [Amycolatopsis panacis]|uniref:Uncharacterized protein n=1 Tax=Amycolatopsis panacis TaxID=2340917 RepID=A0A419IC01_9PSEU|nr:hypothetical protein [Amycolatopsis panacis]RJQ92385.1 hypothetical protein D5S19_01070 [Amycolatopsis panacis]
MELTGADVDNIPRRNVRVPVREFARVWYVAEQGLDADPRSWALFGVAQTCRWLACATVRPTGQRPYLAGAPVTGRFGLAHEETIEAEAIAADVLLFRRPVPLWLQDRPGWALSVHRTFSWAWHKSGILPVEIPAGTPGG